MKDPMGNYLHLPAETLEVMRTSYNYPPATLMHVEGPGSQSIEIPQGKHIAPDVSRLKGWSTSARPCSTSSVDVDRHHHALLWSTSESDQITGLLSVQFWGFYSGADGRHRSGRALARAKQVINGKKNSKRTPLDEILDRFGSVRTLVTQEKFGDAILDAMKLPGFGMSFASKLVAFLCPEKAGVYDSVVAALIHQNQRLFPPGLWTDLKSLARKQEKKDVYEKWCHFCSNTAERLNHDRSVWMDWDGIKHPWRAVDVERAIFAIGREDLEQHTNRLGPG